MRLLTYKNTKLEKGGHYLIAGLSLAPHTTVAKKSLCPKSTPGCRKLCIYGSGYAMAFPAVKKSRIQKTKFFLTNQKEFIGRLKKELKSHAKKAKNLRLKPACRLNVYSDIAWEKLLHSFMENDANEITFFDYTKIPNRMHNFLDGKLPQNYYLTFSRSENNWSDCEAILSKEGCISVVFHKTLPKTYKGYKVINGEKNDYRWLDKPGTIVGLKEKVVMKGQNDTSGFVVNLL